MCKCLVMLLLSVEGDRPALDEGIFQLLLCTYFEMYDNTI